MQMRSRNGWGRGLRGAFLAVLALGVLSGCASTPAWFGLDADPLYDLAMTKVEARDWNQSVLLLERFLVGYPGDPRAPEARMALAEVHFEKKEFLTAAAEYERFLQRHPSHGRAPTASLGVCRSYEALSPNPQRDQDFTRRAVDACRATFNEFPGMNVAEEARAIQIRMTDRLAEAWYQEALFYQRRNAHDSAILVFQDLVDFYPQTAFAPRGFLGLYRSYRAIGWDLEAEQTKNRLLTNYPDSPEAAELRGGTGSETSESRDA
jgi:outer membrane protein assembly factor BamD